ncbi:MAG: cytochrome c [Planctomycetes bacterium]|nr:cytochrome c [Planctomycetota bacterium]
MRKPCRMLFLIGSLAAGWLSWSAPAASQGGRKVVPKLVPIAETKLLMEGLAHANFRGLERHLKQKPTEDQAWTFARGQALLLAETANLLMLRPPRNEGESAWFERAMDLRSTAARLAQAAGKRDYAASRAGFVDVANACNRCHQTFKVKVLITPFEEAEGSP